MKKLWMIILVAMLIGCSPEVSISTSKIVTDSLGKKYRLVSEERALANNTMQIEMWERIDPVDTNHWYTPTLASKLDTNSPPIFQSLMR